MALGQLLAAMMMLSAAPPGDGGDVVADDAARSTAQARGSVQGFADDLVAAMQERALVEDISGSVRVAFDEIRGLDSQKVRATLLPRVRRAMKASSGPLVGGDAGPLTATVALSEEQGHIWAVVLVNGPGLPGPSTIVLKRRIDRELEVALGAVSRQSSGRFVLERVASLPSPNKGQTCPVLDLVLLDIDNDPSHTDELAVLSTCGVSFYRSDEGSIVLSSGPFALPAMRWPRVSLGWLVSLGTKETGPLLWAATSAGHSVFIEARSGRIVDAPGERVPLRGVVGKEGPHALHWRFGSPGLSLPLVTPGGIDVTISGLPNRVRDLARLAGDAWVFVSEDGSLAVRDDAGVTDVLASERVGDRLLVVDVDGDGESEILTTSSSSPGEADQVVVRRLSPGLDGTTVLLKSPLGGGSVAAMAGGLFDFDARLDVMIIEELSNGEAMVWRLEHAP